MLEHGLADNEFSLDKATGGKAVFAPEHQLYSVQRTYKPKADDKEHYSSAAHEVLDQYIKTLDNVTIDFNTDGVKLLANDKGQVLSVEAVTEDGKTIKYTANKGVVMATGGYSGNFKLMGKYAEHGADYLSSTTSMGEGLRMMQEVGANVDEKAMSYIPTFPMGVQTGPQSGTIGSTYTREGIRVSGVNQEGKRFVNEQEARVDVREVALEEQPGAVHDDIHRQDRCGSFRSRQRYDVPAVFQSGNRTGEEPGEVGGALDELAALINVPAEALKAWLKLTTRLSTAAEDEFGRSFDATPSAYSLAVNKIEGDKFYAIPLKALVVMTLDGVSIDTQAHVLDESGTVIPGLYAAGECTGGIWGKFVSGGTGVMGPITFGRIAGRTAMTDTLAEGTVKAASNLFNASLFEKETASADRFDMSKTLKDGEYTATVEGQEGQMTVKTTIADGKISAVEIVEQHETAGVADKAISDLPAAIVAENSVNVDTISGCTLSSGRILDAVTDCLNQASAQ